MESSTPKTPETPETSSGENKICVLLKKISQTPSFVGPFYFLKNEIEGRAELASYLEDTGNIGRLNKFFQEHGIATKTVNECVYGSIGSSSSQIFVPSTLDAKNIDNAKVVNIVIERKPWSVVLVSDNVVDGKYIVFDVLQKIYGATQIPIAISNAIAHAFYGKDKTYKAINSGSSNFSATLKELKDIITGLIATENQTIKKQNLSVLNGFKTFTEREDVTDTFLSNTVVIPRIKVDMEGLQYKDCTVQNGWTSVLSISGKKLVDIGGGKTNPGYESNNAATIIAAVNKENNEGGIAVLTGKIRSDVETNGGTCINESLDITVKSEYAERYFTDVNENFSYILIPSTPSSGGRRTRRRRRARKTKKSRRKNRRKTKK